MAVNNININPSTDVVEILVPGPPGPPGPVGPTGSFPNTGSYTLTGSLGVSGSFTLAGPVFVEGAATSSYIHLQPTPSAIWDISHGLEYLYPSVTVYDANRKQILPKDIQTLNTGSLLITFDAPEAGYAYLNISSDAPIPNTLIQDSVNLFSAQAIIFGI
jgi:hypothetical protein